MTKIIDIKAREILDSRGNPTIEAKVTLDSGIEEVASVSSGASTGKHEALELRDGDSKRFSGNGVLKAVANIALIFDHIKSLDPFDQKKIDQAMIDLDGTPNKSKLGANATLSVSLAVAKVAAQAKKIPFWKYLAAFFENKNPHILPLPQLNILNGGAHTNWQSTDLQEFMIAPIGAPNYKEALRWGVEVYHTLKKVLKDKGYSTNVGDEGGFAPKLSSNEEAIQLIIEAIKKAGYKPGEQIALAIDAAASEFYENGKYNLRKEGRILTGEQMIDYYADLCSKYPIISIEDGLAQDDWGAWANLTARLGSKIQIVGDDLLVTNPERIKKAIAMKACNALLIKPNQIGTLSETVDAINAAKAAGWNTVISHRSGETDDSTISDLAVGLNLGQIKAGAPARGERVAKYNRLLEIEAELGNVAVYAGNAPFSRN